MRYGEKLRKVNVRRSRGREFVVEVPKLVDPDKTHKMYEEEAAKAAGIGHVRSKLRDDDLISKITENENIIAKTKKDAIAGAHILSALHLLYGVYKKGYNKSAYSVEELAKKLGYIVDSEDEKHFKKAVGFVEWLSGKYPKKGQIILPSPDEIEKNIDEITAKIVTDLGITSPEEKEMIKKYILASVRVGRAIASALEAKSPQTPRDVRNIVTKALLVEKNSITDIYNIRRKIGIKQMAEDPHVKYPETIAEEINRIIELEKQKEEEKWRKTLKELETQQQENLEKRVQRLKELMYILEKAKDDKERQSILKEIDEIATPAALEVIAKVRPDWAKRYVETKINVHGKDPREFIEEEKLAIEKEFMEEFLKQHGFLKEVEEKAEEIKERVEKIEKAMEQAKVEGAKAGAVEEKLAELMEQYPNVAALVAKLKKKGINVDVETLIRDAEDVKRLEEWVEYQGVHKNEEVLEAIRNSGLPPEVIAKIIRGMARRNASPQDIKNALELLTHLHREHGDKVGPVFKSSRAVKSMVDLLKTGDLEKVIEDIKKHQGVDIRRILEEDDVFASKLHEIMMKNYSVPVPAGWADVLKKLAKGSLSKEEAARILALHSILKEHYSAIERLESELEEAKKIGRNPEAVLRQKIEEVKKNIMYGKNVPDRLRLAMQILGKDKVLEVLKDVHEKEIQPFIENRKEILQRDPKRITFDAGFRARVFGSMEHGIALVEGIARGNGVPQGEVYLVLVKRLSQLAFEFLGRKAIEARKRKYMPSYR